MRVTIVKDDNVVQIDGVSRTVDCSKLPADFHALQWRNVIGEVEYTSVRCEHCNVASRKQNATVFTLEPYQPFIDAWNAEDLRVRTEEALALQTEKAVPNVAGP